jgi:hypothetical protein
MESASPPRSKSSEPTALLLESGAWLPRAVLKAFLLLPALLVAVPLTWWIYVHFGPDLPELGPEQMVRSGIVLGCILWFTHLRFQGVGLLARAFLATILGYGCWLSPVGAASGMAWLRPAVAASMVYVLIASIDLRRRTGDLQAVASVALVLPLGIVAGTPVLAACALLSVLVLFDRREMAGGAGGLCLLLFTPLITCGPLILFLQNLNGNTRVLDSISFSVPADLNPGLALPASLEEAWPLILLLVVLLVRLLTGRSGRPDLFCIFLPVATMFFHMLTNGGDTRLQLEIKAMLVSGAASLLALSFAGSAGMWLASTAAVGLSVAICFHEEVWNGLLLLYSRLPS